MKRYILSFIIFFVIGVGLASLYYYRYGFWTNNPDLKKDLPTQAECDRDFKIGATTQVDLMKVRGEPTKVELNPYTKDSVQFFYNTHPNHKSVGCSYKFDKDGKLQQMGITFTVA